MINKLKFVFTVAVVLNLQWVVSVNAERVKNIVETLVIVDKEFADLYGHDYEKIANYLTVYFWDVNSRFKSLWSVDISIQIVDLLIIKSKDDQPFVEQARGSDGRTYYEKIFNLFRPWLYANRDTLIKHDLAFLITNSIGENEYGIATVGGVCSVDLKDLEDLGAVVVYDRGLFKSMGIAAHEIGHSLGAEHDDADDDDDKDDNVKKVYCPKGFLMNSESANNVFFFSNCTDSAISSYVNSKNASCLRQIDAVRRTSIDTYFSTPKAGTMLEICTKRFGPKAKIDEEDESDCKLLNCQSLDKHKKYVTNFLIETVENIQCVDDDVNGRCFRGRCRPESKLLQHVASGKCLKPQSGFGVSGAVIMVTCPTSNEITPLDTIEIIDTDDDGKLLASPYLDNENKESGDKCLWIGEEEADRLWTDICDVTEEWQIWNFEPVKKNSEKFYLVNAYNGKCVRPTSHRSGSMVQSIDCSSDNDLIWKWFEGQ